MNYSKIIKAFRSKKILVIGDIILDRYVYGKVSRISPEAPVPVVDVLRESFLLGGASNVANNVIALGAKVSMAGIIGKDTGGRILKELLLEKNIDVSGIIEDQRPTTVKTRVIAHSQQIVRFDREDPRRLEGKSLAILLKYIKDRLAEHDAVIISDYKKGVISAVVMKEIVKAAGSKNVFVAVDPKIGHFHLYKGVSILTPNVMEASHGSGVEIEDERSLIKAGNALMKKLSCGSVLITRSEEGMSLFAKGRTKKVRVVHIPTVAQKVFDVTGAGDTVIAAFTLAHVSGAALENAAVIANHAAGIVVAEVGTAVATPEGLISSLLGNNA